jgi:hypothetical protein
MAAIICTKKGIYWKYWLGVCDLKYGSSEAMVLLKRMNIRIIQLWEYETSRNASSRKQLNANGTHLRKETHRGEPNINRYRECQYYEGREIKRKAEAGNYMNWNVEIRQNNSQKLNNHRKKESRDTES